MNFSIWLVLCFNVTSSSRCCRLRRLRRHHCVSVSSSEEQRSPDVLDLLSRLCWASAPHLHRSVVRTLPGPAACALDALASFAELRLYFYNRIPFTFQPNFKCLMHQNPIHLLLFFCDLMERHKLYFVKPNIIQIHAYFINYGSNRCTVVTDCEYILNAVAFNTIKWMMRIHFTVKAQIRWGVWWKTQESFILITNDGD